jgi:actin-like ATPase involved in cell morphogenesis
LKARQLKECLEKIPSRVLRDAYDRITGDGSKLAGAIRRFISAAERRPREAF